MTARPYRPGGDPAVDPWWYIPEHARVRYDLQCRSIPNALRLTAQRHPDLEAMVAEDGRRTFAQLDEDMVAAVRAVQALGVQPGDRVAVWAPNSGRCVLAALGILGAGGVLVPVNTRFKGEEAAYILRKSGARALFLVSDFLDADYVGMLRAADPSLPVLEAGKSVVLSGTVLPGQVGWAAFLSGGTAVPESAALAAVAAVTPE